MILILLSIAIATTAAADTLRIEKPDRVGRRIENQYFIADLSHRTIQGREEDSGTLRALTYKEFGVTFHRTNNRMHWAPNLSRVGAPGYKGLGTWHPVQEFREKETGTEYVHYREGYMADYPEIKIETEYRFLPAAPYFLFRSRLNVEKPLVVRLLRNNQMTMDDFFTHLAWPKRDEGHHVATFGERHDILEAEPIPFDAPWVAFLNLDKGYGYGYVNLAVAATKTVNPRLVISDGAGNGKYWSRHLISRTEARLDPGDRFEERTAFVLFRCSEQKPLEDFFEWQSRIRLRFGREEGLLGRARD